MPGFVGSDWLLIVLAVILSMALPDKGMQMAAYGISAGVIALIWLVYVISLVVRRLHDLGRTGWLSTLFLLPLLTIPLLWIFPSATTLVFILTMVPPLFSLYLLVGAGYSGMNRFGTPNPPNSMLVNIFGGICSFFTALTLLLQVAILTSQFFAPGQLEKVVGKYSGIDPHRIERMMRQYQHKMDLNNQGR